MSTVVVVLKNGEKHEFVENTLMHQIGNGAVQIIFKDGSQKVFNEFSLVDIIPSEEEREAFLKQEADREAAAEAQEAQRLQAMAELEDLDSEGDTPPPAANDEAPEAPETSH